MVNEKTKISDLLKEYPFLKEDLIKRNKRFKNLNNPIIFNTVARFARIKDIAKTGGEDLDKLLQFLEKKIADN